MQARDDGRGRDFVGYGRRPPRVTWPGEARVVLSLVVIFLPVSFMSSVSGRFLYSFGVTAAVAILVSLLVSFSLTPMMSSRMLSIGQHSGAHSDELGVAHMPLGRN